MPAQTSQSPSVAIPPDPTGGDRAWVITVNMGYGHQRAAYPLRDIAWGRIIAANADQMVDPLERKRWVRMQSMYERLSRLCDIPVIGPWLWAAYDRFQRIASFYPFRDLSRPTLAVLYLDRMLRKGFGMSIIGHAKKQGMPIVSTFFVPPLAAAMAGVERVFSIVTDSDINRIWVARNPRKSNIHYLVPTQEARMRLLQYGVPHERIFITGFPLPEENLRTMAEDMGKRLGRLDPKRAFLQRYGHTVFSLIGAPVNSVEAVTITYAVGGAGAQKEVAVHILASLAQEIRDGIYRIHLIAGTRVEVRKFFEDTVRDLGLEATLGVGIRIQYAADIHRYFDEFSAILRTTDILWTKPSELVFYAALGIPLVMSKPLGAHEESNRDWIRRMGAGYPMEDPRYASEWLRDWIDTGMLAEAAFDAYSKAPRHGTENVRRLVFSDDPNRVELRH
jgi:hypothetical protein